MSNESVEYILNAANINVTSEYVSFYENSSTFHIIRFKDVNRISIVKYPIKCILIIRSRKGKKNSMEMHPVIAKNLFDVITGKYQKPSSNSEHIE